MTIKDLKEALEFYPDDAVLFISDPVVEVPLCTPVKHREVTSIGLDYNNRLFFSR
jgi:hypothetical protein